MKKFWKAGMLALALTLGSVAVMGNEGALHVQAAAKAVEGNVEAADKEAVGLLTGTEEALSSDGKGSRADEEAFEQTAGAEENLTSDSARPNLQLQYEGQREFRLLDGQIRQGDTGIIVLEGAEACDVKWVSSNPSIVTVDSDGKVTAKRQGTAALTVQYTSQKNVYHDSLEIQVVSRLEAEQKKFPTGSYWNNGEDNDKVTMTPCTHQETSGSVGRPAGCRSNCFSCQIAGVEITGYQCHGFALKVASDLYGSLNQWKYCASYRDVSQGDVIRINGSHTIIVTKVFSGSIQYADCNGNNDCQIRWGQTMTKDALRAAFTYMYTRK